MNNNELKLAEENLEALRNNPYPGRGLVIGYTHLGITQACWLMGRSENSRNRVYIHEGHGTVRTAFADPRKGGDPSLVIYNAMREQSQGSDFTVSNGAQTDTVVDLGKKGDAWHFHEAIRQWSYEPDAPNFTPRITGICPCYGSYPKTIAISRRSKVDDACIHSFYEYKSIPTGFGYCVTTYKGDGNPLPAFEGDPYPIPLTGDTLEEIADNLWDCLDRENRVAIAVKVIDGAGASHVHIHNARELVTSTS